VLELLTVPHAQIPDDHGGKVGVEGIAGQRDGSGMSRATFLGVVAAVVRASDSNHPTSPTFKPGLSHISPASLGVNKAGLHSKWTTNGKAKKEIFLDDDLVTSEPVAKSNILIKPQEPRSQAANSPPTAPSPHPTSEAKR
jgi:hypothetical protein